MANGHPHFTEAELAWRRAREQQAQRNAQRLVARDQARRLDACLTVWAAQSDSAKALAERIAKGKS